MIHTALAIIVIMGGLSAGCTALFSNAVPQSSPPLTKDNQDLAGQISITDTKSNTIILPHPARRIITQNGMVAEVLVGIGEGDAVVGTCDTLFSERYIIDRMPNIQSVGAFQNPSIERIVALKPDIMIVYASHVSQMDQLTAANISVMYMDCSRIRDIPEDARKLGLLTGNESGAERYAGFIEQYLDLVDERLANLTDEERPRVYIESFGTDYTAYGPGSSGDSVLKILKAKNIAENISLQTSIVAPEWVASQNPDVIIKYVSRADNLKDVYDTVKKRPSHSNVSALRNNRVYAIKNDVIAGPRGIAGLLYLAKMLYPERFADIDPEQLLHEYAATFVPGSDDVETYLPVPQGIRSE